MLTRNARENYLNLFKITLYVTTEINYFFKFLANPFFKTENRTHGI